MRNAPPLATDKAPLTNQRQDLIMADQKIPHQDPEYKMYVYVIESEAGVVKIGFSGDPQARLLALLTGHPFGLDIVYTRHHGCAPLLEKIIHRILQPLKIRGEWFKCSRAEAIAAVDAAFDILLIGEGFAHRVSKRAQVKPTPRKHVTTVIPFRGKDDQDHAAFDEKFSELRASGLSIRQIAAKLGCTKSRVEAASRRLEKNTTKGRP
jgi:hypothetical protein